MADEEEHAKMIDLALAKLEDKPLDAAQDTVTQLFVDGEQKADELLDFVEWSNSEEGIAWAQQEVNNMDQMMEKEEAEEQQQAQAQAQGQSQPQKQS